MSDINNSNGQGPYGQNPYTQNPYNQNPAGPQQSGSYNNSNPGMTYQNPGENPDQGAVYQGASQNIGYNQQGYNNTYNADNYNNANSNFSNDYNNYNNYNNSSSVNSNSNSGMGIVALILTLLGCTYFIGLILGIVALVKKDGRKKGCAIAACIIGGVWLVISIVFSIYSARYGDRIIEYVKRSEQYQSTTSSQYEETTEPSEEITTENYDIDDTSGYNTESSQPGFNADEIAKNLIVKDYTNFNEYYNNYYMVIENPSSYVVDIEVSVNYYDSSDKLTGTDSYSVYCVDAGKKALFIFFPDEAFAKADYKISVKEPQWYVPATNDIKYEVSENPEKLVVTVKNTSDQDIDSVEGSAIFYKDGQAIGSSLTFFVNSDYKLKAGEEISKELNCYAEYDSYEFFIYPKRSSQ